jgi:hypothetical protein
MKVVRSSPLRTGRLRPQEFSWYSFLEAESTPGHMAPSVDSDYFPGVKRLGCEVDHFAPSSAEVGMSAAVPDLPLDVFIAWAGIHLPLPFISSEQDVGYISEVTMLAGQSGFILQEEQDFF